MIRFLVLKIRGMQFESRLHGCGRIEFPLHKKKKKKKEAING